MIKLTQHELDLKPTLEYFKYNLTDTNTLSSELIKLINFESGRFFALLPDDVDQKNIHNFQNGGIASGIRNQIAAFILSKLQLNRELSCIFDDVAAIFKPDYKDPLFFSCGLVHEKEIYYLVTPHTASFELLTQCFLTSNAIWHSLCILAEIDINKIDNKILSIEQIKSMCLNTLLIVLGAYDAEGYIFWEHLQ